ncbi:hypothetical protein CK222_21465 [Mesorhizobium sp. WSM3866]|uniref:hypothetical protein n=1 Tax=Mesorhizobium sp. WSM3866 TaxID=422271 RepID=UPI000BB09298|nr:hypothetical protein [Mesorhizobium sp. WSM3866]PBB41728.1 hypothetical protein CK222_21465 [Mesorhizobium sp. WSM3866]
MPHLDPEWLKQKIIEDGDEGEIGAGFELFPLPDATPAQAVAPTEGIAAWLIEGLGWKRVFIEREAAERLANIDHGELVPLVPATALTSLSAERDELKASRDRSLERLLDVARKLDASEAEASDLRRKLEEARNAGGQQPLTLKPCEKDPYRYCNCEGFYPACRQAPASNAGDFVAMVKSG